MATAQPFEILSPELRGAVQPQAAVAPNGNYFVVFGKGSSVYCTTTRDGKTFRKPVEVASLPKLALGMRRGPRIAASDLQITISAISHADGNLYAWTSADGGLIWSKAVRINSVTNSAREGLHALASDRRGNVYAAWLDLRNQGTQLWGAASHDGGITWSSNTMIYQSPDGHICECCHSSVEVSSNGFIRVMWRNWLAGSRDMYLSDSTDGGNTFAAPVKLGPGTWPLNGCPMDGGGLAGSYSIWRRKSSIYYTDGPSGEHSLGEGKQPVVGLGKDGPIFIWEKSSQLMWSKGPATAPVLLTEQGAYPSIAAASENKASIIVWESITNGLKTIFAEVIK